MLVKGLKAFLIIVAAVALAGCKGVVVDLEEHPGDNILLIRESSPSFAPVFTSFDGNVDEVRVPNYELPDVLKNLDGSKVTSAKMWNEQRRKEIIDLYKEHMYGDTPEYTGKISYNVLRETVSDDGSYIKKQVEVVVSLKPSVKFNLLLILPNDDEKHDMFLGLNFSGNQSLMDDEDIIIGSSWANPAVTANRATRSNLFTEESRGVRKHRLPVDYVVGRGYALATVYHGDIDPDYDDGFENGVHALFQDASEDVKDNFSTISAWAWGLSRVMDYLMMDEENRVGEVILYGHSRLGKTALWAGALDERFAMVISNNSGAGGAALSRRQFGETVEMINYNFPHWFNKRFKAYDNNEDSLPVDQHMLISLIAPRPVYVASATEDSWADPKGEFLSLRYAAPVYELLAGNSIAVEEWPKAETPILGIQSYHLREGRHDLRLYDWIQYINAADRYVK